MDFISYLIPTVLILLFGGTLLKAKLMIFGGRPLTTYGRLLLVASIATIILFFGAHTLGPIVVPYFLYSEVIFWTIVSIVIASQILSNRTESFIYRVLIVLELVLIGTLLNFYQSSHNQIVVISPIKPNAASKTVSNFRFVDNQANPLNLFSFQLNEYHVNSPLQDALERGVELSKESPDLKQGSIGEFSTMLESLRYDDQEQGQKLIHELVEKYSAVRNIDDCKKRILKFAEIELEYGGLKFTEEPEEYRYSGWKPIKRWFDQTRYVIRTFPADKFTLFEFKSIRGIEGDGIYGVQPFLPDFKRGSTGGWKIVPTFN